MSRRSSPVCGDVTCACATVDKGICGRFEEYDGEHCAVCLYELIDHKPLTELQSITADLERGMDLPTARAHIESLLAAIGQIQAHAKRGHDDYEANSKTINPLRFSRVSNVDDQAHEIDEIIEESLGGLVPGTGGAWGVSCGSRKIRSYADRSEAIGVAMQARFRGTRADVYAKVFTGNMEHKWELQDL